MKVLVTGAAGQIGSRIALLLNKTHHVTASVRSGGFAGMESINLDFTDEGAIRNAFEKTEPEVVIHCGAITSPEKCEKEQDECTKVNVDGSEMLAKACADNRVKMIYLSTDLVFDGEKGGYDEGDETNPLNFYASSKLKGEKVIAGILPSAVIARTAIVFGRGAIRPGGFSQWLIDSLRRGEKIWLFTDQFRSHFYIGDCARAVEMLMEGGCSGIYHLSPGRKESRFDFGMAVAKKLGLDENLIVSATMAERPSTVKRPKDCSLNNQKLVKETGFKPTPFDDSLETLKREFS